MNFNFIIRKLFITIITFYIPVLNAQTPVTLTNSIGDTLQYNPNALWDQMSSPGTSSITSQNFESAFDSYDSYAAEQFGLMDDIWSITKVEVRGKYFGGTGNAESVNVWFYNDSSGFPGQVIHSSLNVIPTNGLSNGSFSIPLNSAVELNEGMYWVSVQANMNFNSSGQWGWTTKNNSFFNESVWKNPGAGFGTTCTVWNRRVQACGIGTSPGLCFSLIGDHLPVELTSFYARIIDDHIDLVWTTATELNNSGFEIERKSENSEWEQISFVPGNGTTAEPHHYTFTDKNISEGNYFYRLKQVDFDGTSEYSKVIEVKFNLLHKFDLYDNYPNPFNPTTKINFSIPSVETGHAPSLHVSLKVYDVLGNEITTLVNEYKPAGTYEVEFDGSDLPSGFYFYTVRAGEFSKTKKMILMK